MNLQVLSKQVRADQIAPERLAGSSLLTEREKIAEASRQFEAILVRQILESSQKTVFASKYTDQSTVGSVYKDMVTQQLADSISQSGAFGIARSFEAQLSPMQEPDPRPHTEKRTAERT